MKGFLTDAQGRKWELPVLLRWDVSYGMGDGCDSFSVAFAYDRSMQEMLQAAARFQGVYQEETVFTGVVDEFQVDADADGAVVTVTGRGMQALLLDNEAAAAVYYGVGLEYLLDIYVRPWGIKKIRQNGSFARASIFSVDAGMSLWGVLERYCRFTNGILPRFSPDGVLILGQEQGKSRVIDKTVAVIWQRWSARRYGVISQVLVHNSIWGSTTVNNPEFQAQGGSCRRVIGTPRRSGFDAQRYTGEYQIRQSQKDRETCEVELAALFAAFPGDRIRLEENPLGVHTGDWLTVSGARCYADGAGAGTRLTLVR